MRWLTGPHGDVAGAWSPAPQHLKMKTFPYLLALATSFNVMPLWPGFALNLKPFPLLFKWFLPWIQR